MTPLTVLSSNENENGKAIRQRVSIFSSFFGFILPLLLFISSYHARHSQDLAIVRSQDLDFLSGGVYCFANNSATLIHMNQPFIVKFIIINLLSPLANLRSYLGMFAQRYKGMSEV